MSLQSLINSSIEADNIKQGLSEERLNAQLDNLRSLIAFYR